jgi:hypothetical protein
MTRQAKIVNLESSRHNMVLALARAW